MKLPITPFLDNEEPNPIRARISKHKSTTQDLFGDTRSNPIQIWWLQRITPS